MTIGCRMEGECERERERDLRDREGQERLRNVGA